MSQNRTNINIKYLDGTMIYLVEKDNKSLNDISSDNLNIYKTAPTEYQFVLDKQFNKFKEVLLKQNFSNWEKFPQDLKEENSFTKPDKININYLNIYFPEYSADVYNVNISYAVNIYFYINEYKIQLGSYLLNRNNSCGIQPFRYLANKYYDYISIPIVNPHDIINSSDWLEFKESCYYNNADTSSLIHISIHPVIPSNEVYIVEENYIGSENLLPINEQIDIFKLNLNFNLDEKPIFHTKMYSNISTDISQYIKNKYQIEVKNIRYELFISDSQDIYKYIQSDIMKYSQDALSFDFADKNIYFEKWDGYHIGMNIFTTIEFSGNIVGTDTQSGLKLLSNKIPLTQEIFKYLISTKDLKDLNQKYINLDNMNMEQKIINIVNKKTTKIVQLNRPDDVKSNIIYPVFYESYPASEIQIHSGVIGHICINLDIYKSKVKKFNIKIADKIFPEIGRTSLGVVFKIDSRNLNMNNHNGLYYILNSENELITTGNYKYI